MTANAATMSEQAVPADSSVAVVEADPMQVVKKYTWWAAGAGLIPFPAIDMATVAGVQIKMLKDLAEIYKIDFPREKGKVAIGALVGGVAPTQMARGFLGSVIKGIPVVGPAVGGATVPIFAGASTYAVGRVFIQHFASGGTFLDFDPAKVRKYYAEQFEHGKKAAAEAAAEPAAEVRSPEVVVEKPAGKKDK
jgi:uncharacterized protein (DUF697 family)